MARSHIPHAMSARRLTLVLAPMAAVLAAVWLVISPAIALGLGYRPVISQVYGGGTSTGDTYDYDYIELHNPAPLDVNVEGWSVQYAARDGSFNQRTDLHGVIPAGGYLLVREGGSGTALPVTPDIAGTIAMHNESAKVALVYNTTLIGANFTASSIVDFLGYGNEATAWEGPAASYAPDLSPTKAAVRKSNGNQDTDNNAADFDAVSAPGFAPRNSLSTPHALAGPMDITLTGVPLVGTQPVGTPIGTLASVDPERTGPFTYALVSGAGSADNASFSITGDTLLAAAVLDPAVQSTYSVRVRSTDPSWLGYERALTITIRAQTNGTDGTPSSTATSTPRLPATGFPPMSPSPMGPWPLLVVPAAVAACAAWCRLRARRNA